jgi:hypothetical protein
MFPKKAFPGVILPKNGHLPGARTHEEKEELKMNDNRSAFNASNDLLRGKKPRLL